MTYLEDLRDQAAAIHEQAAGLERANAALEKNISLTGEFGDAARRVPARAADSASGGSSRTIQGPNGLELEILGPDGSVISVVPLGPQAVQPPSRLAGAGGAGTPPGEGAANAPPPGGSQAGVAAAPAGGAALVRPSFGTQDRNITGKSGGATVIEPEAWLDAHCKRVEVTIPDPSVPGASLTYGPWVRHVVWSCDPQPELPAGGLFTADMAAPNRGLGFGGSAERGGAGTGANVNAPTGGTQFGAHIAGSPTGIDPTGKPIFAGSTAGPSASAAPSPGDRLVAAAIGNLGGAVAKLAEKIGADNGGLSLRAKGLTF